MEMELVAAEGTSHNASVVIDTEALGSELEGRGRDLERYSAFVENRDGGRTAVKISPEAINYLGTIAPRSRLALIARAMPYTRANGRPRVETHAFAMAMIGPKRLEEEGVAAVYAWHKENRVRSQSQNPPSVRLPTESD